MSQASKFLKAGGEPGMDGKDGADGKPGATGPKGEKGEAGTSGRDGRGVAGAKIDGGNLILTYTDGTAENLGRVLLIPVDHAALLSTPMAQPYLQQAYRRHPPTAVAHK